MESNYYAEFPQGPLADAKEQCARIGAGVPRLDGTKANFEEIEAATSIFTLLFAPNMFTATEKYTKTDTELIW